MGYRELSQMENSRWSAAGKLARSVTGLARETVSKYLPAAGTLRLLTKCTAAERGAGGGIGAARVGG
jgi:hypothetical protein